MPSILLILSAIFLVTLIIMTYRLVAITKKMSNEEQAGKSSMIQSWIYAAILFTIIVLIAGIYLMVRGTVYESHLMEWLNIIVRVMHITFGIAWIGASFYFVFRNLSCNKRNISAADFPVAQTIKINPNLFSYSALACAN